MTDPSGFKNFTDGAVLPAEEIRGYLQQGVMVFDDAAARDSTLVGALREGMIAYVKDTDTVSYYDGSGWNVITGQIAFASEAARDAAIPNPVDGRYAYTEDLDRLWLRSSGAWTLLSAPGTADFSDAATGTYTDGGIDYKYKTYTGSGSVTITRAGFADILIVGGGAGGGRAAGGGGGAGGYIAESDVYLPAGTLTIRVGAGGAGGDGGAAAAGNFPPGFNGVPSSIGSYIAGTSGGGGGGYTKNGDAGGSGGGGAGNASTSGGTGFDLQGKNGGNGAGVGATSAGGGGGGANANGSDAAFNAGGAGGAGLASSITNSSVTRAGGGGGGCQGGTAGSGGTGGGGAGTNDNTTATAGTVNTGGGGGGGGLASGNGAIGGAGGSGVVIIRVRTN